MRLKGETDENACTECYYPVEVFPNRFQRHFRSHSSIGRNCVLQRIVTTIFFWPSFSSYSPFSIFRWIFFHRICQTENDFGFYEQLHSKFVTSNLYMYHQQISESNRYAEMMKSGRMNQVKWMHWLWAFRTTHSLTFCHMANWIKVKIEMQKNGIDAEINHWREFVGLLACWFARFQLCYCYCYCYCQIRFKRSNLFWLQLEWKFSALFSNRR